MKSGGSDVPHVQTKVFGKNILNVFCRYTNLFMPRSFKKGICYSRYITINKTMIVKKLIGLLLLTALTGCAATTTIQAPIDSAERSVKAYRAAEEAVADLQQRQQVLLIVNSGGVSGAARPVPYEDGITALSILMLSGHTLETTNFAYGTLVDAIDGVRGGSGGKYWIYYVNGSMGTVAAEKYELNPGDQVEWRFQDEEGA